MNSNILSFKTTKKKIKDFEKRYYQYQNKSNFTNQYIHSQYVFNDGSITFYINKNSEYKCVVQAKEIKSFINKYKKELDYEIIQENDKQSSNLNYENNNFNHQYIIGTDEVGVGDYFGGIVVCAVYVGPKLAKLLRSWGVDDSKKVNDNKIKSLAKKIMAIVPYEKIYISNQQYNQLINKFNNSHIIKTIGHFQVINQLQQKMLSEKWPLDSIVIDKFSSEYSIKEYLKKINVHNYNFKNIQLIEHAESQVIAVACASILARYFFLIEIEKMSEKYLDSGSFPLGAWNKKIENEMMNLVQKNNIKNQLDFYNFFENVVKLHFKNSNKIIEKIEKKN